MNVPWTHTDWSDDRWKFGRRFFALRPKRAGSGLRFGTFSKEEFIELETLSPLKQLAAGESVSHMGTWHLFGGVAPPDPVEEAEFERWLATLLPKIGIL